MNEYELVRTVTPEQLQVLIKNKVLPDKSYDNLEIGHPNLPVCTRCGIRRVSKGHRKICQHCGPIGGPPLNDSYRCQRIYKWQKDGFTPGTRCNQPALTNEKYCKRCIRGRKRNYTSYGKVLKVTGFYQNVMGPTLKKLMEQSEGQTPEELTDVRHELTLARAAATPDVKIYNDLLEYHEKYHKRLNAETLAELNDRIRIAGTNLQKKMDRVVTIAEKANKIYKEYFNVITVERLHLLSDQLVDIMFRICGEQNKHLAEEFEREARLIQVPEGEGGVLATIDGDEVIAQMVKTIGFSDETE